MSDRSQLGRRRFLTCAVTLTATAVAGCTAPRIQSPTQTAPETAVPTTNTPETTATHTTTEELGLWEANDLTVLNHRKVAVTVEVVVTPSAESLPVFERRLELGPRENPYSSAHPESGATFEDIPAMDSNHEVSVSVVGGPSKTQSFGPRPDSIELSIVVSDETIEFREAEV
ncbi:hypothetical protein KU306_10130 [Haloferax larsenii]|uniref:Tat (Twin-arginine translocation) pathway signal sequence n=1 Tax=Haloferax larsenii TaxID=302484 RepID=A0ABY5RAE5_HALLR|nr:hypothetical protein [Haloferax larsenii]UVE49282.1 hypothetical protein KU306_10130 [Haloferax larsenii]